MHIVTAEIRKAPRIHNETLFILELAESFKNKDNVREYTNYTFFLNAKTHGLQKWYADALQVGKVVSISFDQAKIVSREHNGTTYNSIQPAGFANLVFSQFGGADGQQQGGGSGNGWGQPQQPKPQGNQQNPRPPASEPPMDFDDDIPF